MVDRDRSPQKKARYLASHQIDNDKNCQLVKKFLWRKLLYPHCDECQVPAHGDALHKSSDQKNLGLLWDLQQ